MSSPVAGLPMYDWPEVRGPIDALWVAIADRLRPLGVDAPNHLWRPDDPYQLWTSPDLLVSDICGFPVAAGLRGRVEVLGALDHGVEGCPFGDYRSVLICRVDDPAEGLDGFARRRAVVNGADSHSGYGSLVATVAPLAGSGAFFEAVVASGSHRESIRAVAEGRADLGVVDDVSWRLGLDHEPGTDALRVLSVTKPAPAPPLVTGWSNVGLRDRLNEAISDAVNSLDVSVREPLHLYGYLVRPTSDYDVIAEDLAAVDNPDLVVGVIEATGFPGSAGA